MMDLRNLKINKTYLVIAVAAVILFLIVGPWFKVIIGVIAGIWLVMYFGEAKVKGVIKTGWEKGKAVAEEHLPQTVDEEIEVKRTSIIPTTDGKYQIVVLTEKGNLMLKPQKLDTIPEGLQSGKKLQHRIAYEVNKFRTQKVETLTTEDERVFKVV